MPVYGYLCKGCKHEYEIFYTSQSKVALEEKHEQCPSCKSKKKKKLVSSKTSHIFKSGKWFKDGY